MPRNDLVRGDARPTEPPRAATGALGPIQILIRVGLAVSGVCGIVALIYHLKKEKKLCFKLPESTPDFKLPDA